MGHFSTTLGFGEGLLHAFKSKADRADAHCGTVAKAVVGLRVL